VSILACASSSNQSQKGESGEPVSTERKTVPGVEKIELTSADVIPTRTPLNEKFDNIIFRNFETSEQLKKDYPYACENCKASIISKLKSKNTYENVTDDASQKLSGNSLIVDMQVVDMRIAGAQARFWGGAFAGNSFMDILVELKDADSEEVLHKKVLSTTNSAMAAAWTFGASDRSLPTDLGTLIGEYLYRVVPGSK
jgi:hypothetical protein